MVSSVPMFARVATYRGTPEQIEEGLHIFREHVLPWARGLTGFRGWIFLLDRGGEKAIGVSFWASEEAMKESVATSDPLREKLVAGLDASIESLVAYEVAASERFSFKPD
jgi:heme-degrading monooxygenase HmoA